MPPNALASGAKIPSRCAFPEHGTRVVQGSGFIVGKTPDGAWSGPSFFGEGLLPALSSMLQPVASGHAN